MNILDLAEEAGYTTKRKAATNGGEYAFACPFCKEGNDRFLIWPNQTNRNGSYNGGRYSCRVCGKYGDAITFLRDLHGLKYRDACSRLEITPKNRQSATATRQIYKPPVVDDPPALWTEKATAFVEWCHSKLKGSRDALAQVQARGFSYEIIERFKVGYNPGDSRGHDLNRERQAWGLPDVFAVYDRRYFAIACARNYD